LQRACAGRIETSNEINVAAENISTLVQFSTVST
jgi:hypothetical protein